MFIVYVYVFYILVVVLTGIYVHVLFVVLRVVYFLVVTQGFCVCIDMVHGLSASELLLGLKSKGVRSPDVSRALGRKSVV